MDDWGFEQLQPWLQAREQMPVGPLFCVINGRSCGRAWHASAARAPLRRRAARAGVRRRFAPHQLRHAHALELLREGVPLNVIQRQLGHRNLGVASIYLQGIDPYEIIETVHARRPADDSRQHGTRASARPMIGTTAAAGLSRAVRARPPRSTLAACWGTAPRGGDRSRSEPREARLPRGDLRGLSSKG